MIFRGRISAAWDAIGGRVRRDGSGLGADDGENPNFSYELDALADVELLLGKVSAFPETAREVVIHGKQNCWRLMALTM